MRQKIYRSRRSPYRRRAKKSQFKQIFIWILVAAVIIPGSFFAAKWIDNNGKNLPAQGEPVATTTTKVTTTTTVPPVVNATQTLRGVYLPHTVLSDTKALADIAKSIQADGFNSVVIELKDRSGKLLYASETEAAKQAKAATADAITLKALTDAFAALKKAGLSPVPLLYAFEDATAPVTLPKAMVTLVGNPAGRWYDADPNNGGRPWLNPYADAAQAYITALAEELETAGAAAIMLDGVYFPTQILHADFKSGGDASLSEGEVLEGFMLRMDTVCEAPILLRCDANAALGNNLGGYHKNPLSLGAQMVVVDACADSLGDTLIVEKEKLSVSDAAMSDIISRLAGALKKRYEEQPAATRPSGAMCMSGDVDKQVSALLEQDKDGSYFVDGKTYTAEKAE